MSFKDILAVVLTAREDEAAIRAAEIVAAKGDAHVSVAFLTPLPDEPLAYEPSVVAGVWAELLTRARADAQAEREKVEKRLAREGRPADLRIGEALARDLGRVAAVHARYADLAVMTRPSEDGGDGRHDLIEGVLFYSGRPALIVPPGWKGDTIGAKPLIAWDASREATRALSEAYDLIEDAPLTRVMTIDAKAKAFGHGESPGANIAAHLERRGVKTEVRNVDGAGKPPAAVILDEAMAYGADLVVMGGYAHARIRQYMFGGATRDMLEKANLPVLMAH
ncbi:MAG TPA: universal stress protein [Caulobacterales bacterium]|jgi:nucleotide-binding universal stress UspA family protein|nr:universal stress protein [Caulobacterales bacterium]